MKNLSTSKLSGLQNTWSRIPWATFLFLLAVFAFSTPLIKFGRPAGPDSALAMNELLLQGTWYRQASLLALAAFALFNILRSKSGRFQINGLLGWLILFYLVWATLSITWSINPLFTLKRVGILLILSISALYVANRFSLQETIALVFFICAITILGGVVFLLRHNYFYPFVSWWRFGGNMHPIMQGWHCGLLMLSAFALSEKAEQNRALYIGISFIAFLLLIITRSRGPFLAFFVGTAVYWSLITSKRYQGVLFFLGIIIVGCLMYFMLGYDFVSFGEKVIMLGRVGEIESATTLTGRAPLWTAAMILVDQRPFVGYGYESFLTAQNLIWITEKTGGWTTPSVHSAYIYTLGGLGYIGGVSLVLILFLSVKKSIGLARRNPEYAFVAAVLVWLTINMIIEDQILTRPVFPVFLWMILLARLGFIRQKR